MLIPRWNRLPWRKAAVTVRHHSSPAIALMSARFSTSQRSTSRDDSPTRYRMTLATMMPMVTGAVPSPTRQVSRAATTRVRFSGEAHSGHF